MLKAQWRAINNSRDMASKDRAINEWWIEDVEGSVRGLIQGTIQEFTLGTEEKHEKPQSW
jgi:hypothetical protein